jgi:hypothetical protein
VRTGHLSSRPLWSAVSRTENSIDDIERFKRSTARREGLTFAQRVLIAPVAICGALLFHHPMPIIAPDAALLAELAILALTIFALIALEIAKQRIKD